MSIVLHLCISRSGENATKRSQHVHCALGESRRLKALSAELTRHTRTRRKWACKYVRPPQDRTSTPASGLPWSTLGAENDPPAAHAIDFPTVLFLDPSILQHRPIDFADKIGQVPEQVLCLLGGMGEIRAAASRFFEHMHTWMPFISKKRFYDLHLTSQYRHRPDIILLLLALRLITTLPPTNPRNARTPLYNATKHFYLEVEGSSVFSVPVLQAGVLLALYEVGHGIYPAAYLTIGACARYAHALGMNINKLVETKKVLTLVEVEEKRRVWWAIVILDRFVFIVQPIRHY